MKKSLSLIVAIAMIFSLFSSVAFAADKTAADKFNELKAAGIFTGTGDGDGMELSKEMDRASAAVIVARLAGLTTEASTTKVFDDVDPASAPAPYIAAAVKAGIIHGNGDGTFSPYDMVKKQDLAVMLTLAYGVKTGKNVDTTATADVTASAYALPYIKAALDLKLFGDVSDWTSNAIREDLVNSTYATNEAIAAANAPATAEISSLTATGAKKLAVAFNMAVDTSKASFAVSKGSISVNVAKTTWSDDNKTATLELSANMTKGDYTVSVSGLTDAALSKTATVDNEKVAKITFDSDKAPVDSTGNIVTISYKVYNQYDEDVTSAKEGSVQLTSSLSGTVSKTGTGVYTVNHLSAVTQGTSFTVTALYAVNDNSVFASQVYTVSPQARIATVSATKLYNADSKTLDASIDLSTTAFYVLLDAKDQYGNSVVDAARAKADLVVSSANTGVAALDSTLANAPFDVISVDGTNTLAIKLANPTAKATAQAGTTTVFAISNTTGSKASFDVTVKDVAKLDVLTLSSPDLAVAGDGDIRIPFTAVDQFGNAMNKASDLQAGLSNSEFSVNGPANIGDLVFKQDYVKGEAYLTLDTSDVVISSAQSVFVTAVTATGKVAQLTISLQPNAKPQVITGVDDFPAAIAKTATAAIANNKIAVVDQYGQAKHLSDFAGYSASVTVSDTAKATVDGTTVDGTTTSVTATGAAKGSTNITLKLYNGAVDPDNYVSGSDKVISLRVVEQSEIADITVDDVATLYAGGTNYAKALTVSGLLDDGTKVTLPNATVVSGNTVSNDYYSVTEAVYGLSYSAGKLTAAVPADGDATVADINGIDAGATKTFAVVVTGNTKNGPKVVSKEVQISKAAPVATTLALQTNGIATKESDGVLSVAAGSITTAAAIANDGVKVTDQYGVAVTSPFVTVSASNFSAHDIDTVVGGDTFNVVAITGNAKSITFKVIVK